MKDSPKLILIGAWADASWGISFYRKNGYRLVTEEERNVLLRKYWSIPERQAEIFENGMRETLYKTALMLYPVLALAHSIFPSDISKYREDLHLPICSSMCLFALFGFG